ncbi:TPA: HAMP domain-containing histidine kinase [Burkholderia aenigmatica]|uniref:ATP-binding protein n=1 Tax=Burkholderia sp. AU45251 TaxID=3059204 RepID=UPI002656C0F3|nr:ATP-binding protein [Burkholderia sp. AU45251]HDR9484622.1 HAMP domain-containing histidine kinase [Burkholderia aenigmatica]MDN7516780.1 ATP-binding protein [Burkholderia sp. AU45251]HDR9515898.1 HAMP domain-containing histidine kinase [Burkholderia aenigmatica]HDR9592707.1 HAMP domain-containing histidine kinase [Burkholderia aenigmatica]HDR9599687.1 HAMP domain-containing histidine kinase [Burkholderia aenigmatica]
MKLDGLSRQIALTMAGMAFGVTVLVVVTAYTFYYIAFNYWSTYFDTKNLMPTAPEWGWLISTTLAGLALSVAVAVNLARRILVPLNSVTDSIRRVARGDLDARAVAGDRSLHEAALLADNFNALADELQRVTNEQAIWNAAIAHELRTPVTVLRGRLQGLAEGVFKPDEAQFRSLLAQVEGLTRLIEDLRVVSLADGGHLSIEIRDADLAAEVLAVVDVFAHALQAAGQHPVLDLDTRPMRCDPVRIRQALLALLENARRHAVPGAIRIQTRIEAGMCRLRVEDDGPGIAADFAPHVFKAFRRADDTQPGGSGLGLAVVAAIAHAHHGEAVCVPTGTGGTLFEVQWPDNLAPTPENERFPA